MQGRVAQQRNICVKTSDIRRSSEPAHVVRALWGFGADVCASEADGYKFRCRGSGDQSGKDTVASCSHAAAVTS